MIEFSEQDLVQLSELGIDKKTVLNQIETFKAGIPFIQLEMAAKVSEGILKFSVSEENVLIRIFEQEITSFSLLKFVPASGAASRMFKALFNFLETFNPEKETFSGYMERTNNKEMQFFFDHWEKLAFFKLVQNRIKGLAATKDEEAFFFVKEMLSENGLNYGFYPKGLLPFHNYGEYAATPFEEHLKEGAAYASVGGAANLHFTISEQHGDLFNTEFNTVMERVSTVTKTSFNISYSYQKASTDTIAVDMENQPFRNADGSLVFRPGGHGALIENLNEQNAAIIFIKNIDNVVVPQNMDEVTRSKKALGGLLLRVQSKAYNYADLLENTSLNVEQLKEIKLFLEEEVNVRFVENFNTFSLGEQIEILKDKINRPIRICGMVKNEGEPGGGPFWIKDRHNHISLQIVESAQVDMCNQDQLAIFRNSTHFNPVDLVCGTKNYKGEKYNLLNFVNPELGFITNKTQEGRDLKALELPGLWNGAMAFWNTIFVEVPSKTFNPVKTVNDLIRPTHQV